MVRRALKVNSALELNGASVCTQTGTTTELNLADYFAINKLTYTPLTFAGHDETVKAFQDGKCLAYTTDSSGLAADRSKFANPADFIMICNWSASKPGHFWPSWRRKSSRSWRRRSTTTARPPGCMTRDISLSATCGSAT